MPKPAAVALLVLLTACSVTPSEVAADAPIDLRGVVSFQDGSPAAKIPVSLVRHEGVAESLSAVLTLGASCVGDEKSLSICKSARRATSGRDGRFSFALTGRDTQGLIGDASTLEATAQAPRAEGQSAGPSATIRFLVQTQAITLPLRFWEPSVELLADGRTATAKWADVPAQIVPPGIDAASAAERVIFQRGPAETVWIASGRSGLASFDPRVLEDSRGTVSVAAEWTEQTVTDDRGRTIDLILRSGRLPYRSRAGAPPSRGAACSARIDGQPQMVAVSPCPLTDGDFVVPAGPPPCASNGPCGRAAEMIVDWASAKPLAMIVVRGCAQQCVVATATDPDRWTVAGTITGPDAALMLSRPATARFVRVSGQNMDALREVSMWQPPGPAADPRSLIAEATGLAPPIDRIFRGEGRARPILAAALLLALIGGALGATALQRSGRRTGA